MVEIEHRDMTRAEREALQHEASVSCGVPAGWSSGTLAVLMLFLGSFVVGLIFFGIPLSHLAEPEDHQAALLAPAVFSLLLGGGWSTTYYLRGAWRVSPRLLEDLDYGRVEVLRGIVVEAWVVDDTRGTTWLLDIADGVIAVGPPASTHISPRTLPGRHVELVRCKHSGLVLRLETSGPPLAPSTRLRCRERELGIESARFEGGLEEVTEGRLGLAA